MTVHFGKMQTIKNVGINCLAFGVQVLISLYVSPILISKLGTSAYGFIGMAQDFTTYFSLIASVFNAVAARFIAVAYYKADYEKANGYFNSLVIVNIFISCIIGLFTIIIVPNLNEVLTIPIELVFDVKLTFALVFLSYIVSLITLIFTTSTFVSNRTDLQGIRNAIQQIIRFGAIVVFLNFVSIKLYWVAIATLISTFVVAVINVRLTKSLTPELSMNLRIAKISYAKELAKYGYWMAFDSLSIILIRGSQLIIANQLIGSEAMGLLSIARIIPNHLTALVAIIVPLFSPGYISLYTNKSINRLVASVKNNTHMMATIMFVPLSIFMVYSYEFFSLWQENLVDNEIKIIAALSNITIMQTVFNCTTSSMAQLSIVTNKLHVPVLVSLGCGILVISVTILLLHTTNLGLFGIVIPSTVIMILRYAIFNALYAAHVLNLSKKTFIGSLVLTWVPFPVLLCIMYLGKKVMTIDSWGTLLIAIAIYSILGYAMMLCVFYRKTLLRYIRILSKKLGNKQ